MNDKNDFPASGTENDMHLSAVPPLGSAQADQGPSAAVTDRAEDTTLVTRPMETDGPNDVEPVLVAAAPAPGAPADRRSEVARWVVSWVEPLLTDEQRLRISRDMGFFIDRNPDWSFAFLAGVLTDLAHSLPSDDPWRHMAALIDLDQVASGIPTKNPEKRIARRSERAPLPGLTGAITVEGRPFGTRRDALDLIAPGVADSSTDVGMAAVATNLSPLAAALIAFASHDAQTFRYVVGQVYHHLWVANFASLIEESAGQALLDACGQAVRWLLHRRRAYLAGTDDAFASVVGFAWIPKADRVNKGESILSSDSLADSFAIPEGEYRFLTGTDEV